jgi:MFS family permease
MARSQLSLRESISIIMVLAGVNFLNTMGSGILTVALPQISKDLHLQEHSLFWPASVYALAAGCTLLIFGSIADVLGPRPIWILGSSLYALFTLACGLSRTGIQLMIFIALLGICIAMCLPTSTSLTTTAFARGSRRNICVACIGMGRPLGYSIGLILGKVFVDTIGWRYGYFISAILNVSLVTLAMFRLPRNTLQLRGTSGATVRHKSIHDIDWIGAGFLGISMGIVSYVLA